MDKKALRLEEQKSVFFQQENFFAVFGIEYGDRKDVIGYVRDCRSGWAGRVGTNLGQDAEDYGTPWPG